VNDPLLVRVLNGVANRHKENQPFAQGELMLSSSFAVFMLRD